MKLNIGCGRSVMDGWVGVDCVSLPSVDVVADLEKCRSIPLPFEDGSVDEMLLSHTIEHISDTLGLMQELHRIAKPESSVIIRCPFGSSDDAWEDPTHRRAYFLGSFGYFSQPFYWRADYGYRGDWKPVEIVLVINKRFQGASAEQISSALEKERNVAVEMIATLTAVKPIRHPLRALQSRPNVLLSF